MAAGETLAGAAGTVGTDSAIRAAIARAAAGEMLGRGEARAAMESILAGSATPAQIAALAMGLRVRGETSEEIAGFVEAMAAAAVRVRLSMPDAVDLCGTGGDGSGTINISTAAALVAAAAGARVAKHGNRSASSRSGSADVLEKLGVPIELPPERAAASIEETGFGFLFAPLYHPAMRHAAGPRREIGVRTFFNLLGPLSSPAGVKRQLLGVSEDRLRPLLAAALLSLGCERAWVVHARREDGGGLDEIGLEGPTRVTEVLRGELREIDVVPEDAGIARRARPDLRGAPDPRGGTPEENARRLEAILRGERGDARDAVVLNAAAALAIAGRGSDVRADLKASAARAVEAIDSGRAWALVEELRRRR